jgi:hypothetical protein
MKERLMNRELEKAYMKAMDALCDLEHLLNQKAQNDVPEADWSPLCKVRGAYNMVVTSASELVTWEWSAPT